MTRKAATATVLDATPAPAPAIKVVPTPAPSAIEFNSEAARQIAASELDAWATDYTEAARALKSLVLDLIRKRQLVGDKSVMHELKTLEV